MKSAKFWNEKYHQGENISKLMREDINIDHNSKEIIEMSYELQSGSYSKNMKNEDIKRIKKLFTEELVKVITDLTSYNNILEAGIGEATTFSGVISKVDESVKCYGFDLSWSRIAYANKWLNENNLNNFSLCTGDLMNIPFLENSIDIVYTCHSIEPNRGNEKDILKELYRITNKYLILLEPGYELTNEENRKRMESHKYCKKLKETALNLGYNVLEHKLFKYSINPVNPTAITIIEKNKEARSSFLPVFACPLHKTELSKNLDCYYSKEAMSIYPIIMDIPCLRTENSILATKFEELKNK